MRKRAWTTMICFLATLLVLVCTAGRGDGPGQVAWGFAPSVDVTFQPIGFETMSPGMAQSPMVAVNDAPAARPSSASGTPPAPTEPQATAAPIAAPDLPPAASRWPAIILGTVVAAGAVLVVLFLLGRRRDE